MYENNVTLKNKHDALMARIPSPHDSPTPSRKSLSESSESSLNFDSETSSPRVFLKRHARRISVSPADISLLSDQNAELLLKIEKLEAESTSTDRAGRRALKRLESEIQLLRDELEKTQARSEQLEKTAQVGTEKLVEEMWKKKKEREARFRAMRNNTNNEYDASEIRDFAPPGMFSKASLTPSPSMQSDLDVSYGEEPSFEHPLQPALVSQLLSKIQELEDTNRRIIQQQSETTNKLHAVQRETESISKVYECFSGEDGVEWEVVGDESPSGAKSPVAGTIRFRSFRRDLDAQSQSDAFSSMPVARAKTRRSVINLFDDAGTSSTLAVPFSDSPTSTTDLSPLRFDTMQSSQYDMSPSPAPRHTLQSELGDELLDIPGADPFLRPSSLYDLSFSMSPSPSSTPKTPNARSLRGRFEHSRASRDLSSNSNALLLSVDPPLAETDTSSWSRQQARYARMSQTLFSRTSRWADVRFPNGGGTDSERPATISSISGLPQRLSSALDVVMENFAGPRAGDSPVSEAPPSPSVVAEDDNNNYAGEGSVVLDDGGRKKRAMVAFVLEVWLWLQFVIIIVVFLWAMARRGPKSVLGEAERRAVVRRR